MGKLGRDVLSVLLGVVSGILIIAVSDAVSEAFYPLPPGVDPHDPNQLREAMATMPLGAILILLVGWTLGNLVGAWTAARIGSGKRLRNAMIVGGILLAGAVFTALSVPPPLWFWIATIVLFLPGAFLGGKLAERKTDDVAGALAT